MDPKQYKQKKKRAVDPNAPPRPNLLSHEKRMKESDIKLATGEQEVARLKKDLQRAERRIGDIEQRLNDLVQILNNQARSQANRLN